MFGLFGKRDANRVRNDKVRKALAAEGDDGKLPRHVIHFVFPNPGAEAGEEQMQAVLRAQGLEVDPSKMKQGLMGEETREVASADFDARTAALSRAAEQRNWRYDGWECAVVTNRK